MSYFCFLYMIQSKEGKQYSRILTNTCTKQIVSVQTGVHPTIAANSEMIRADTHTHTYKNTRGTRVECKTYGMNHERNVSLRFSEAIRQKS